MSESYEEKCVNALLSTMFVLLERLSARVDVSRSTQHSIVEAHELIKSNERMPTCSALCPLDLKIPNWNGESELNYRRDTYRYFGVSLCYSTDISAPGIIHVILCGTWNNHVYFRYIDNSLRNPVVFRPWTLISSERFIHLKIHRYFRIEELSHRSLTTMAHCPIMRHVVFI